MNSRFLPSMVLPPLQVKIGMNGDTCGVCSRKMVCLLQDSSEPFCRQSSQGELSWYLHILAELAWDRLRALQAAITKNPTFTYSPQIRTFGLELRAPSLHPLALQPVWAGRGTETFTCQKLWCFQVSLCGESERKVETSESKR